MLSSPFTHQLEVTNQAFIDNLNLPGAVGKRLKQARASDEKTQISLVADYFRTRKTPRWCYYMHGTPWHETDAPGSVLRKADRLLHKGFINSWPPHQEFDLQPAANSAESNTDEPDWMAGLEIARTSIARWTFVTELSTAFALTGNPAFARRAMELMRSYVHRVPFVLHPRFAEDHDQYFGGPSNQTLHVAYRMFRVTDFLHSGVFHARTTSGEHLLSDADLFWVVKQLWFYAMQYYRLIGDRMRRDNHHLVDHGHTPYVMGVAFPEFAAGTELVRAGREVIHYHFGHNLLADGSYSEHSAEYQYHILYHFLHPLGVSQANGITLLSPRQIDALRRWVEFSVRAVKPDGWLPAIGDSGGRPVVHLLGALAGPVMAPPHTELAHAARSLGIPPGKNVNASMSQIAGRMKNIQPGEPGKIGLSAYFLDGQGRAPGSAAKKPAKAALPKGSPTCQYPAGGYTFFRSDWDPKADYLAVSHFPPDMPGGHSHWDPMSFLLHTHGRTLIGEPASNLYEDLRFHGHGGESPTPPPGGQRARPLYRGYTYSVNAHNCLVMNDDFLKPIEAMNHGTFWGGHPPVCHTGIFAAGGPIEVAEIWHDANAPTRMRRFFIHFRGIGFAFVDIISSPKMRMAPMQYSQYFHFEGDVEISSPTLDATGQSLRAWQEDSSCLIIPGREVETRWRTFRDPYLHDTYMVPATKGLPWIAELTRRVRGNGVFATFLLTHPAQEAAPEYLGSNPAAYFDWQREGLSAHRLNLGSQGAILLAAAPFGQTVKAANFSTDAELAIVLLDSAGQVKSWAAARGSSLIVNGRKLLTRKTKGWIAR